MNENLEQMYMGNLERKQIAEKNGTKYERKRFCHIKDYDYTKKTVIVRVDFNVPMHKGKITSLTRIEKSLMTIKYLLDKKAKVVLISHLGRPNGVDKEFSLAPVKKALSKLLKRHVQLYDINEETKTKIENTFRGDVILLENIRFFKEEEENNEEFAKLLASFGDYYIFEAFGTAHRAHASTSSIAKYLPSAIGFLVEREISRMSEAMYSNRHPKVLILGGAKVEDKLGIVENLVDKVDYFLFGGGVSYPFLQILNKKVGDVSYSPELLERVKNIMAKIQKANKQLLLPVDHSVIKEGTEKFLLNVEEIPDGYVGRDVGERTIELYAKILEKAEVVIWNGPMGQIEEYPFEAGTRRLIHAIIDNNDRSFKLVGGGSSEVLINKYGLERRFSHVSTGGGVTLKMLEGKELPSLHYISVVSEEVGCDEEIFYL